MSSASLNLFCPYQIQWIDDASPMKLCEKSRRVGFSYADAWSSVEFAAGGRGDVWYTSADLSAAREYMDYCGDFARLLNITAKYAEGEETVPVEDDETTPGRVIDERKIYTVRLTFNNGFKVTAGSSNPNFFRSKGGAAKLDELAFHRDQRALVKAAHATSQFWGYPLSGWSSHHGENSYFNQLIKAARAGQLKSRVHRVTIHDAVEQGIVERIIMRKKKLSSPPAPDARARQEWLDELRATCPDADIWAEEYECRPVSEAGSLMSYELIQGCEVANLTVADTVSAIEGIAAERPTTALYLGYDVGRKHDRSVLWVWEKVGDVYWLRVRIVLKDTTYSAQEDLINLALRNAIIRRAAIDSTGIGNDLAERLVRRWGHRIEAVYFTSNVKQDLAMPLQRLFQDRRARIDAHPETREALHKIRRTVTSAGNVRLDADRDDDGHADEFWAAALALHAADDTKTPLPPSRARKPLGC